MIHLCCRYPQRDSLSHLYTHTLRTNTVSDQDSTFSQSRPGSYWCGNLEEENVDCLGNVLKWAVIDFIPDLSSNQPSQFPHRSHRTQGTDRSLLSSGEICVPLSAKTSKVVHSLRIQMEPYLFPGQCYHRRLPSVLLTWQICDPSFVSEVTVNAEDYQQA